ncbi:molybdenum cofactor guanylyltransferase [Prauserella muralis]|uniref:Molybdopterin-guanine dinucleotide biosynthesis protein MobA n=1 Tax=Prauserella muralis TaxID=588067 RepID=A0A2V4APK5_9PSEU|nr:molybdenum cofactor guanylyltransferase [Prauserella muralis]PXY22398.1 molybdopterin-guanine dinucleotide biosynthesis protein MobA [Prauserella muralis]TWE28061.1 molybdopterin-guanine dinucleotide biosynthesis protein A [Prauserella muralis]
MTAALAGIVLAGGAARRLSGADKPMLVVGGTTLLQRAVTALRDAADIVVVGPRRDAVGGVRWCREDPPGAGPVAALAAGLRDVGAEQVAVLAADLSGVTPDTIARLRAALGPGADGAVLVDDEGRRQWLIGVWRTAALRAALPEEPAGASLRATLGGLSIVEVAAVPGEAADVDTPGDLPPGWR